MIDIQAENFLLLLIFQPKPYILTADVLLLVEKLGKGLAECNIRIIYLVYLFAKKKFSALDF